MPISRKIWPRCFAHVDMMSFFASIEQQDFPELANKPIAVTNTENGTTIITASYEARAFGINTGTKLYDALKVCPHLIQRPTRPSRYVSISQKIMKALETITPDIQIYSIDEAWLELTAILGLYNSIEQLGEHIRQVVSDASDGLPCSIGISEGKLTAKYCGEVRKGHTTIIPPGCIASVIGKAKVGDICGIGKRIEQYLNAQGIIYCRDMQRFPMSILSSRFGNIGKRLYLTCLGHDPEPLTKEPERPKSMGHGKVMPPKCTDIELISTTLHFQIERLAARLRKNNLTSDLFFIGFKTKAGWIGKKVPFTAPIQCGRLIWAEALKLIQSYNGYIVRQVQITAIRLHDANIQQLDLFASENTSTEKSQKLDAAQDAINNKFGKASISSASLLTRNADTTPVIAPAWRPNGAKQSI